jgi:hypothetical protein
VDDSSLATAFGLDLRLGFPVPGIRPGGAAPTGRLATVEHAERTELVRDWRDEAERLREWTDESGRVEATLDLHPELGWRLVADGYGAFVVSPGGSVVRCAPVDGDAWRWQRCLIGQILPLTALLNGLEVFHAAAVAVGGRALGLVGASQAGKSSVAIQLVLRGAELLADDVLALDGREDALMAHPGPGIVSVRHGEAELLADDDRRRLGTVLGYDDEAVRIEMDRGERPLRLEALYFLVRGGSERPAIDGVWPPDPRMLLGSTFNFVVATRERLTNQLEICTRLARETPLFKVQVPAGTISAEVAAMVEAHMAEHE